MNMLFTSGIMNENGEILNQMLNVERPKPDYNRINLANADPTLAIFHEPKRHCICCHVEIESGLACQTCLERFRNELCR